MVAELICIGDELLIGQTINTNAAWMGEHLNAIGLRVHRSTCIADDKAEIIRALDEAASRSSIVLITGGLGPTKDDITKKTLCEYFDTGLIVNQEALERITSFFASRGLPMLEVNNQQAELPESCTVIQNYRGTACGMWFERDGVVFVSMPGVPYEMTAMMEGEILGKLKEKFNLPNIFHRTILTTGVGESFMAEKIKDWETSLAHHSIHLAYLPSPGMLKLRMSVYGGNADDNYRMVAQKEKELLELIGDHVYGYDKDELQEVVGKMLRGLGKSLSVAESCTGGYIAHLITSVPGSSDYFVGGVVPYAAPQKTRLLGVDAAIIERYNVVSREVAEEMAIGARDKFGSDYSISVTGIAGPDGGTEQIPVGTIWIALASEKGVRSALLKYGNRRENNIQMASYAALNLLRKEIL